MLISLVLTLKDYLQLSETRKLVAWTLVPPHFLALYQLRMSAQALSLLSWMNPAGFDLMMIGFLSP